MKGSETWDWTSLMEMIEKFSRELQEKMESLIPQDTAKTVVELWKIISHEYSELV